MKTLITLLLAPAALLLTCILTGAPFIYFIFAVPVGFAIGFLMTVSMFWILGTRSRRMDIKKTWHDEK
jgi:hypothetical protein